MVVRSLWYTGQIFYSNSCKYLVVFFVLYTNYQQQLGKTIQIWPTIYIKTIIHSFNVYCDIALFKAHIYYVGQWRLNKSGNVLSFYMSCIIMRHHKCYIICCTWFLVLQKFKLLIIYVSYANYSKSFHYSVN